MFKYLIIALAILTFSLHANEENSSNDILLQELKEIITVCDQKYDECATICEETNEKDNIECYAKCEQLFHDCEQEDITKQN